MPDFTMCDSTECPWTETCKRSMYITEPSGDRQSWFQTPPGDYVTVDSGDWDELVWDCLYYWRVN